MAFPKTTPVPNQDYYRKKAVGKKSNRDVFLDTDTAVKFSLFNTTGVTHRIFNPIDLADRMSLNNIQPHLAKETTRRKWSFFHSKGDLKSNYATQVEFFTKRL